MKKIFTLSAVALATVFAASAQELTSEPLSIVNPDFSMANIETPDVKPGKGNQVNAGDEKSGWACGEEWKYYVASSSDNRSQNLGGYPFAVRTLYANENSDITQEAPIIGPGPGVYVLTARVNVAKNNSDIAKRAIAGFNTEDGVTPEYAVLYCTDATYTDEYVYGAPGCAAVANYGWMLAQVAVPYYTAELMPYINIGMRWGQGANVPGSNVMMMCTAFSLEYFPETAEMEEEEAMAKVNEVLKARQAEAWKAAEAVASDAENGENLGISKALFLGSVSNEEMDERTAALQAVRDGGGSGVSDIVVAPVEDNKYYNLQGIEVVEPTQPGLYIHNGKKIVIK